MFKKPYEERERVQITFDEPSRTKQAFKDEANINRILDKYNRTGLMPQYDKPQVYGDFTQVVCYHTAQNKIAEGKQAFAELPSDLRKRFNNDPGQFLDFIGDPESNLDEMVKLGLARIRPQSDTAKEAPAPEPAPAGD
uniref:hypothetical protein n=1 Tax=Shewanella sp. TaxID=50422 RepID=UPI004048DAE2